MKRKGFIHIVEAVVVVMLIMLTLSQFFYFSPKETYWDQLTLKQLGRDILFTMATSKDSSIFFDSDLTKNTIKTLLPGGSLSNMDFAVTTRGAIPPTIRIACGNCTESERAQLNLLLTDMRFNNRTVVFDRGRILDNIEEVNNFTDIDVLVIYGYQDLTTAQANAITTFLRKGKGVVELSNLSGVNVDENHLALFSIRNVSNEISSEGSDDIIFRNPSNKSLTNYKIWEYFSYIPLYVKTNASDEIDQCSESNTGTLSLRGEEYATNTCSGKQVYIDIDQNGSYANTESIFEGPYNETNVTTIDGYNYTISFIDSSYQYYTMDMPNDFKFSKYIDNNVKINASKQSQVVVSLDRTYCTGSACEQGYVATVVANDKIAVSDLFGRSVWIQEANGTDWGHLLKLSIAWAAGDRNELVRNSNTRAGSIGAEYYINYDGDLFEPMKIILTLWYVF